MTKMTRFLALIPVMAFAAACSGVTPTGSSQITPNDSYEAAGDVTAMGGAVCANLARISLAPVAGPILSPSKWIEATYHFNGPAQPCPAPRWTSDRFEMVVDRTNPMRAGFPRLSGGKATLTATALNGVTQSMVVDLSPTRDAEDGACKRIVGVSVKILPSGPIDEVSFVASYRYDGAVTLGCTIAPTWTASRGGLKVNLSDPFRASIARRTDIRTTVTATAPNGVSGKVTF